MQALVKKEKGYGNTELIDIPEPSPGPRMVKAEIKYCGICGTDHKMYTDDHAYYTPPIVLGHEFSAVVVEVGDKVQNIKVGDEIVAAPLRTRNTLHQRHAYHFPGRVRRGFDTPWGVAAYGGFTKYGVYPEESVLKIPDGVTLVDAALTEPTAVCARGIIGFGMVHCTDVAVVSGPGSIGLLAAQIAKAEGATVIVCGIDGDEKKLEMAAKLGADMVFNVSKEDPLPAILDMTYGAGADVVIECAGHGSSIANLINYARLGAQYIQIGTSMHKYEVDFMQLAYKELKAVGTFGASHQDFERSLRLMANGQVSGSGVVSHKMPISQWEEAFKIIEARESVKILLYPDE